jgi:hypothetical protein
MRSQQNRRRLWIAPEGWRTIFRQRGKMAERRGLGRGANWMIANETKAPSRLNIRPILTPSCAHFMLAGRICCSFLVLPMEVEGKKQNGCKE